MYSFTSTGYDSGHCVFLVENIDSSSLLIRVMYLRSKPASHHHFPGSLGHKFRSAVCAGIGWIMRRMIALSALETFRVLVSRSLAWITELLKSTL